MASSDPPLKELAQLVVEITCLSAAVATLGLLARSIVVSPPKPALSAANPPVLASESSASPTAAAVFAKNFVQQSLKGQAATIVDLVNLRRTGGTDDRPRYQAEIVVEGPPGFGAKIRRDYLVAVRYAGASRWEMDDVQVSTKFAGR